MSIMFSDHHSKRNFGRAYRNGSASLFWKTMVECSDNLSDFVWQFFVTYYHEYLHLFLMLRLGKWHHSEKSVIEPLSIQLAYYICREDDFETFKVFYELFSDLETGGCFCRFPK